MKALDTYGGWALVTGASAGIGKAMAEHLASQGVSCVLVARRLDRLEALRDELQEKYQVEIRCVAADLSQREAIERVRSEVGETPIGILINNAGFGDGGEFHEKEADRIAEMVALNCQAVALLTRAFLPQMVARDNGAVITVASTLGLVGCPYEAVYGATKAFDLSFSEALSGELKGTGVSALCVCPSLTATEFLVVEGLSQERAKSVYKNADTPEKIARIAFKALGRRPVVGPRDFIVVSWLLRFLPRRVVSGIIGGGMKRMILREKALASQD